MEPYNQRLVSENRDPITPYLHETIEELLIIPSAASVCPSIEELKKLPIVCFIVIDHLQVIIDRLCAESVLRGSDIFVKGVQAASKEMQEGGKVCIAVNLLDKKLPRGSDISCFMEPLLYERDGR